MIDKMNLRYKLTYVQQELEEANSQDPVLVLHEQNECLTEDLISACQSIY